MLTRYVKFAFFPTGSPLAPPYKQCHMGKGCWWWLAQRMRSAQRMATWGDQGHNNCMSATSQFQRVKRVLTSS